MHDPTYDEMVHSIRRSLPMSEQQIKEFQVETAKDSALNIIVSYC
jgi:hypothetical protein